MPLVPAKCPNCGATLEVNNELEAAVCKFCGSAFVVEKAINNIQNANVIINYNGSDSPKAEPLDLYIRKIDLIISKSENGITDAVVKKIEPLFDEAILAYPNNLEILFKYYECGFDSSAIVLINKVYENGNDANKEAIKSFYVKIINSKTYSYYDLTALLPKELANESTIQDLITTNYLSSAENASEEPYHSSYVPFCVAMAIVFAVVTVVIIIFCCI